MNLKPTGLLQGTFFRIDVFWAFWKLFCGNCLHFVLLKLLFEYSHFLPLNPQQEEVIVRFVKWVYQQSIFHFMCVHTKMYSCEFFPLGWNVLFRSDNKNTRWRKFCFAPRSERNIWKRAGGRERDKECVRGDLSVLGFMDVFFFFHRISHSLLRWIIAPLSQQSWISKRMATYHMVTKENVLLRKKQKKWCADVCRGSVC